MTPAAPSRGVRVSIVTPFLNAGRFIRESIESVLAQTYDGWELLLVDDGSTDESPSIARALAGARPGRIRVLAHEGGANRGASASRNVAIAHARGEYLAFLDADDVYLPRKLEEQIPLLDAHPDAAMLYGATEYWHSWTRQPEDAGRDRIWRTFGVAPNALVEPPRLLATFLRDGGTVPCMGSVLARREAVERVGGWEESFRYICTDQVFHAKMTLRFPVFIADGCWDRYRQHEDSACHRVAREGQADATFERYLGWLDEYLAHEGVSDAEVWAALRAALRRYRHPLIDRFGRGAGRQAAWMRHALARVGSRVFR